MLEQVLEGTWEEIAQHAGELAGKRVRLTVLEETPAAGPDDALLEALRKVAGRNREELLTPDEPGATPDIPSSQSNEAMLEVMRQVAQIQLGMRYTSGADTQRLLREARAGRMFGNLR